MNSQDNHSKNANGAKMEFVARITMEDGTVIERNVSVDSIPTSREMDFESVEGFLKAFDKYERAAVKARNKVCADVTQGYIDELAKKEQSEELNRRHPLESEIGRSFVPVYGKSVSTLKPRQHLCSFSLVELVVKQVRSKSYKEAADTVNGFLHLEGEDAVSHTTLKDRTVFLGMALSKEKQKQTKEILLSHGIDQENGAEPIDGTFSAATVHPTFHQPLPGTEYPLRLTRTIPTTPTTMTK